MYAEYDRLVSFCSVRHAIRAEMLLVKAGIKVVSLPKPREIDANCGQCILFIAEQEEQVMNVLREQSVFWGKLFTRDSVNKHYEEIAEYKVEDA